MAKKLYRDKRRSIITPAEISQYRSEITQLVDEKNCPDKTLGELIHSKTKNVTDNNVQCTNKAHECIIGLLHLWEESQLVTLPDLTDHIATRIEHNHYCENQPKRNSAPVLRQTIWTLVDYADKRKSTNFTRFEYCPYCGKKIDWTAIRKEQAT